MKKLGILISVFWLIVFISDRAYAYEVLILQSSRAPAYEEALKGLRSARRFSERLLVLSDYADIDLHQVVREDRPLLIIALGDSAYTAASRLRQTPVVVLMAPNYRSGASGHPELTGIELSLPPERYLAAFGSLKLKRIGILSNHSRSGFYIRLAQQVDQRYGIELIVREVTSPREVSRQLASLRGEIDALWMLPDDIAVTRETADSYFLFSLQHQVLVAAFSGAYLPLGAAFVIEINRQDVGRQAGDMVSFLLDGGTVAERPPESPRKWYFKTNPTVLRRFGLVLQDGSGKQSEGK